MTVAEDMLLIVNPCANRGRSRSSADNYEVCLRRKAVSYRRVSSRSAEHVEEEARKAAAEGFRVVGVCGGDGTMQAAANALAGSESAMGILAGGRGNDFGRALGIPRDPERAVDVLLAGIPKRIDLGKIGERYFCTVATLGIDSQVAADVLKAGRIMPRKLTYVASLLRRLLRHEFPVVTLEGDFGRITTPVLLAATGNTHSYGAGMMVVPPARPDDGRFHVCLIERISRVKLVTLLPSVYRGKHVRYPEVRILETEVLRLSTDTPQEIFADGEPIARTPAEIRVVPGVLQVMVPQQADARSR